MPTGRSSPACAVRPTQGNTQALEAITWKRLGLYAGPIAIVNQGGFYDPLLALLDRCVDERFMDERHRSMWFAVGEPT